MVSSWLAHQTFLATFPDAVPYRDRSSTERARAGQRRAAVLVTVPRPGNDRPARTRTISRSPTAGRRPHRRPQPRSPGSSSTSEQQNQGVGPCSTVPGQGRPAPPRRSARPQRSCWPQARAPGCAPRSRRSCTRSPGAACSATRCTPSPRSSPSTSSWSSGTGRPGRRRRRRRSAEELARPVLAAVQEKRLGTGHAVRCALDVAAGRAHGPRPRHLRRRAAARARHARARCCADHAGSGAALTLLTSELDDPTGYGRVLRETDGTVTRIVEEADATREQRAVQRGQLRRVRVRRRASSSRRSAGCAPPTARASSTSPTSSRSRTTTAPTCAASAAPTAGRCAGSTTASSSPPLRAELNRRLLEHWMLAGVTVVDPATTWVDVQVRLEPDVVLQPGTQLHGATSVAGGAEVGPDTTLTDCEIGAGAARRPHARHRRGDRARARPSGRSPTCGPGARLGERGKIGTFVEVKNADIGAGTKVPHLTYVGDATIGELQQHRRVLGVRQLRRRAQAAHGRRLARADRLGQHVRRPGARRRRRLHRGRHRACARTCRRGRSPCRPGHSAPSRGGSRRSGPAPRPRRPPPSAVDPAQRRSMEAQHGERDVGDPEEEPDALLGAGAPRAGRAGGQAPGRDDHAAVGVLVRQRRDLRPVRGVGARLRRVRAAVALGADQRPDHGTADHGRRAEARLGEADHRGHAVLGLRAPGQEAPRPRADLGPADRRHVPGRGRRPDHDRRPAHRADPGLLRRPGGPPVRAAGARRARQAHLRRPRARRRLPRLRPRAAGRALGRDARRHPAGVHPQDPRPATSPTRPSPTASSARSTGGSAW